MVQHEDKFFQKVADSFSGFAPEAPHGIYSAVKKRYGLLTFLTWNAVSFNVYYLLMLSAATAGIFMMQTDECARAAQTAQPLLLEDAILLKSQQSIVETMDEVSLSAQKEETQNPLTMVNGSQKKNESEASVTVIEQEEEISELENEPVVVKEKKKRKSLVLNEVREVQSTND